VVPRERRLCGLAEAPIRYITDDCLKFVRRELKRGRHYDAIIMDPPTYGRGSTGEMWKLDDHLWPLLDECRQLLSETPLFFLINAYTARLSPTVVANCSPPSCPAAAPSPPARSACPSSATARCSPAGSTAAGRRERALGAASQVRGHVLGQELLDAFVEFDAVLEIEDAVGFVELGDQLVRLAGLVQGGGQGLGLFIGHRRIVPTMHDQKRRLDLVRVMDR
jgi:hypothetical protein